MIKYCRLSNYLNISKEVLEHNGILDSFIDDDSGVYLNLDKMKISSIKEFESTEVQYITTINLIIEKDTTWLKNNLFIEPKFCSLGDTMVGNKGKGMKTQSIVALKDSILKNPEYYKKMENFEKFPLASSKIGKDALNDFLCNVYFSNLLSFTERKCRELNITDLDVFNYKGVKYSIKTYKTKYGIYPVIFYPFELIEKNLYALTYDEIYRVGYEYRQRYVTIDDGKDITYKKFKNEATHSEICDDIMGDKISIQNRKKLQKEFYDNRYNNLEIYDAASPLLKDLIIDGICDDIQSIEELFVNKARELSLVVMRLHKKALGNEQSKIINSINYKQAISYLAATLGKGLKNNNYKTEIIIRSDGIFICNTDEYIQIVIRTCVNRKCLNDVNYYKKLKAITSRKRLDYKLIIEDPNCKFDEFVSGMNVEKRSHFIKVVLEAKDTI